MAKWEKPLTLPLLGRLKISQSIRRPLPASPIQPVPTPPRGKGYLAGFFVAVYELLHLILRVCVVLVRRIVGIRIIGISDDGPIPILRIYIRRLNGRFATAL